MKDDISTPTSDGSSGTTDRSRVEAAPGGLRQQDELASLRAAQSALEERYRAMTDMAPVLIWENDQSGMVFCNAQYLAFFGVAFEDLGAMGWSKFVHPDDFEAYTSAYATAYERRLPFTHEVRLCRADGQYRRLLTRGRPVGERNFVGCCLDITDLLDAQQALSESDARHRLLLGSWTQAIWETDAEGVVVKDSPSWRAYTGQSLDEWLGDGWLDAIHPEDREYAERQWREAMAARSLVNAEYRLRSPDGEWHWTNVRAAPVLDADGSIVKWAGMNIDIDASKRAEDALRESEEEYRSLFELMDEAYAVVEVLKNEAGAWVDFRFLKANPAFMKHTSMPYPVGKTATELLGTPNPRWTELYGEVLDSGRAVRVEETEYTLGRTFDLNIIKIDRERNQVAVVFTDITERRRAEDQLREREKDLSRVQRIGGVGGLDVDVKGGMQGRRSPEYLRLHGLSPDHAEETHEDWLRRVHPDDRDAAEKTMLDALESDAASYDNVYRIIRPSDGEVRWIHARADIERDGDGKPSRIVGAHLDITDSKHAAQALSSSERHAQILLAELQHRVRNTLAVIRSIARRTADRSSSVEQMVSHFEGRLNAFSRVQSVVTRTPGAGVDLGTIIEDELLAVAVREGEQLRIKGPEIHLSPRAAESISLAVHELATNAVKYGALSADRGRVSVIWKRLHEDGGPDRLAFDWIETGLAEKPEPKRDGFGHEMLLRSLPYDLGAQTDIKFTDDGLRFTMSLPLCPDIVAKEA